ncbi:MAG TPA: hypothetical protein PL042_02300 [Caldisericia bacterium]|nr:hypothetical protein [Caldisericia bacterium]
MDWSNFGKSILENIIASIPQIVLTLNVLLINIAKMKNQIITFKEQVVSSEDKITKEITIKVDNVLDYATEKIDKTIVRVDYSLEKIETKVDGFDERIASVEQMQNQNQKAFMVMLDLVSILVSKNPDLIRNGIAKIVVDKVNMEKQDLQKYPELISTDLDAFKVALLEQEKVIGKENLLAIIEQTLKVENYEEAEREKAKEL